MLTVINPCPICGKSLGNDPNLTICNHEWLEAVTTTSANEYTVWVSGDLKPIDENLQIDLI